MSIYPEEICPFLQASKLPNNYRYSFRGRRQHLTSCATAAINAEHCPTPIEQLLGLYHPLFISDETDEFEIARKGMFPVDHASSGSFVKIPTKMISVVSVEFQHY